MAREAARRSARWEPPNVGLCRGATGVSSWSHLGGKSRRRARGGTRWGALRTDDPTLSALGFCCAAPKRGAARSHSWPVASVFVRPGVAPPAGGGGIKSVVWWFRADRLGQETTDQRPHGAVLPFCGRLTVTDTVLVEWTDMAGSAPERIYLPREAWDDLARLGRRAPELRRLVGLGDQLAAVADAAAATRLVSSEMGLELADSAEMLEGLYALHGLRRSLKTSASELLRLVERSAPASAPAGWLDDNGKRWHAIREHLGELLIDGHPLDALHKARRLSFEYPCVFRRARVVTDLRPVFSADASKIARGVVSNVLVLEYSDAGDSRRLEIALDKDDLEELRAACDRARIKSETLLQDLGKMDWPVAGFGSEVDD